jgi:hypothetical protein
MAGVWELLAGRDFRSWQGLPESARYADLDARFPRLTDAEGVGFLGSRPTKATFRVHVADGYPMNFRAWYDDGRLLLIQARLPRLATTAEELLAALGQPATLIDHTWDVLRVPNGLRIHPDRGIAVFLGPEEQVLELALFTPCPLAEYLERLHRDASPTERPIR